MSVNLKNNGTVSAIGDGSSHPMSGYYGSIGAAQAAGFTACRALTDERDWCAFQSVSDAMGFHGAGSGTIYLPSGTYLFNRPGQIRNQTWLLGDGPSSIITRLGAGRDAGMPLLLVGEPTNAATFGTSLATGPGQCFNVGSQQQPPYLRLSDLRACDVSGFVGPYNYTPWAAICVECFVNVPSISGYVGIGVFPFIIQPRYSASNGWAEAYPVGPGANPAFEVRIVPNTGQVDATFRTGHAVGGNVYSISDPSYTGFTVGVTHHVALTWDGSTVRLFIDGVMHGSAATSGVFKPEWYEDFYFGPRVNLSGIGWQQDGLRVSRVARYTTNFTPPTAKPTADSNTALLCNFDELDGLGVSGLCIGIQSQVNQWGAPGDGKGWLYVRDADDLQLGYTCQSCKVQDIQLQWGSGAIVSYTLMSAFKDVLFYQMYGGFEVRKFSYSNEFDGLTLFIAYSKCIEITRGSGINQFSHIVMQDARVGVDWSNCFSGSFRNVDSYNIDGPHGVFTGADDYSFVCGPWFMEDEGLTYAPHAGILLGGVNSAHLDSIFVAFGAPIEPGLPATQPSNPIQITNMGEVNGANAEVTLTNCSFSYNSWPSSVVHVGGTSVGNVNINVLGSKQFSGAAPRSWVDAGPDNVVILGPDLKKKPPDNSGKGGGIVIGPATVYNRFGRYQDA